MTNSRNPRTIVTHGEQGIFPSSSLSPPIHQTASFRASSKEQFAEMANTPRHAEFYGRYGTPTNSQVEEIVKDLEGGESALLLSSGMGAISTSLIALLRQGDHVVAQKSHYMGTTTFLSEHLAKFGVTSTTVDQTDIQAFKSAIQGNTKIIIVESPSNPTLQLTDLKAISEIAKANGVLTIADNTFATPINQRPLKHGIDLVVHSATKYLGGHHDLVAGIVIGSKDLVDKIWETHICLGAVPGAIDAWLLLRGLRTLPLRVAEQNQTAILVSRFLEQHPAVEKVFCPALESHPQFELAKKQMKGPGGVISFLIKGGYQETASFVAKLKIPAQAASLGGYETLVVHAASMFVASLGEEGVKKAGIQPNLVRLALGLESADDIISDLNQALT